MSQSLILSVFLVLFTTQKRRRGRRRMERGFFFGVPDYLFNNITAHTNI